MILIYLSNYFNHHQKPLADELFKALGPGNYYFVETVGVPEFRKKLGYRDISAPYVLKYNEGTRSEIDKLILDADVVICGEAPSKMVKRRYRLGKLTIRDDESRYKTISRYLKWPIYTFHSIRWNKGYLLCASAFASIDYLLSGMNPSKCYKWGYFPEVKRYNDVDRLIDIKNGLKHMGVSILWVGRLIGWKHPELPLLLAKQLKESKISFKLRMIGTGVLEKKVHKIVGKCGLTEVVEFLGSMSPQEVREYMEQSQILLLTSDRNEGWGAVLNEAMNSACAVVASPVIGSVPYLIEDGVNGVCFKDRDACDLFEKVKWLIEHPTDMQMIQRNAYLTVRDVWSPKKACENLMSLLQSLLNQRPNTIVLGPCSSAPLLRRDWYKNNCSKT